MISALGAGYYLARKYYSQKNQTIIVIPEIEGVSLQKIGGMWSPDIVVSYSFLYKGVEYSGSDYMPIDQLLPYDNLYFSDRKGFPVLHIANQEIISEEYIETFILQQLPDIYVAFSTLRLPHSGIHRLEKKRTAMFQKYDIQFPWTT